MGLFPCRVVSKIARMVFIASLLVSQREKDSVGKKPESLLYERLAKVLTDYLYIYVANRLRDQGVNSSII